jgi:hypothetical protein
MASMLRLVFRRAGRIQGLQLTLNVLPLGIQLGESLVQ